MKSVPVLFLCVLLASCGPGLGPSVVTQGVPRPAFLPEKAEKGRLFRYYQDKGPSKWMNNWAANLDLTGVSWNEATACTLISPGHVVMAAHFMRQSTTPVIFHDRNGNFHERYLVAVKKLAFTDIAVGKLNLPLPPEVKYYRFADAGDAPVGRPAIVSDQTKTLSVHRIRAVSGGAIQFDYLDGLSPTYQRKLIPGDSGHPSFIWKNNELRLLETHTGGGAGIGPFYGDPAVQAAVRAAMAELGD
ncbi:hypothetical protein JIN84_04915 [Luteolibacter yonseiensis]|uniref:Serine protease n=1 Tax=Luteolibacter yonseiensis TaxID=1144680 RepID=A0A934VB18_9BACT|nr:hypothetical protein [Luteolibacter yonseiensis]MBK1814944.1 hypothetical protein [Luteolibacter yonseiensis]